jgi:hypothetical protein
VGSDGERLAAGYIAEQFEGLGLEVRREAFRVSHFFQEVGLRLRCLACAAAVLGGVVWAVSLPLLSALCWAVAAALVAWPGSLLLAASRRLPPWGLSENILARPAARRPDAAVRVVFMAHYDTKSQFLPTAIRVGLVLGATAACVQWVVLELLGATIFPEVLEAVRPWNGAISVVLMLAGLCANWTGNHSPGAIDNGSGVGTLLELARTWRPHPHAPVDVVWVATGAEEVGLDGSSHFLSQYAGWWQEKPTLLINLESVGAGPRFYLAGHPEALALAHVVAREAELRPLTLRILGAGADHEPFVAAGLPAVSILGDVVRHGFFLHSHRDDLARIEAAALEQAAHLAARLAWRWAELHQGTVPSETLERLMLDPAPVFRPASARVRPLDQPVTAVAVEPAREPEPSGLQPLALD